MSDLDGVADESERKPEGVRDGAPARTASRTGVERTARRSAERERDAAARGRDRFSFLAEASRRLADSLDYETTLATVVAVAEMSLEYLGDWCSVDLLDADGTVHRLAVLHHDAARHEDATALRERPAPRTDDLLGPGRAIRTGLVDVVLDVGDNALVAHARDAEHLAVLRSLGVRDYIAVPMLAHGVVLGAITFVSSRDDRQIGDVDLELAEDLANRAAMAIDNARLHLAASSSQAAKDAALRAAHEAGRRKSEFLATMSHEFRTPLNAILGYAQILDMGVLGPTTAAQHAHLERLQASARHLLQLVDDVLDVAKVDADRLDVRRECLMTGASVAAAVSLVHPQATAKGIRLIDLRADSPGVSYLGDEGRVRQILVNLLSNAVKFTPPGGEVSVVCGVTDEPDAGAHLAGEESASLATGAASAGGNWAFIRVSDTGPGITPEFMSRLFEPFVQADGALTREKGGTGLGLAISRRLARRMGGDLTVRSRTGVGSTFTLWLPIPEDGLASGRPASTVTAERRLTLSSPAILRVDDAHLDDAAYAVLHAVGARLAADAETIAERYVAALREDGQFPGVRELSGVQLRDHATPFIGLLASQLTIIGETRGQDPELLGDSGHVQRLMAELHGAQRHRLGWSEADIERESRLLSAEIERAIHASVDTHATAAIASDNASPDDGTALSTVAVSAATRYALDVASRTLDQGSRTAVRSYRFAKSADAP